MSTAILLVDHGSRRPESNLLLEAVAAAFAQRYAQRWSIVEPAHMELAEPSIATAFDNCAARGADFVIVCPYFLGPGKHWTHDIPALAAAAAAKYPHLRYHVTATLGLDDLLLQLLAKRIDQCAQSQFDCPRCRDTLRQGAQCMAARRAGT